MADELSGADIDALPPRAVAAAIALGAAGHDPAVAVDAAAYLRKQVELADLQIADLKREDHLRHWSVVVRHSSDLLRLALGLAVALIAIGFVAAVATAIWVAAHDDSLVIEAFSVPPDLASRGLNGQAIAAQLQDKLAAMQTDTDSSRPAKSYANSWDNGIKVIIPDTGVSVGDLYRTLASWLGNETHITGEVFRTRDGIAITSRSNGEGGTTVTGTETDFGKLLQKSAEAIYRHTQPYRYAVYLASSGRMREAMPIYQQLAENGDREDRLWSHMGISTAYELSRPFQAPAENRKALAIDPDFILAWQNIANEEIALGYPERGLADLRTTLALFAKTSGQMNERARAISVPANRGREASLMGDYQNAMKQYAVAEGLPDYANIVESSRAQMANCLALLHQAGASRRAWTNIALPRGIDIGAFYADPIRIEGDSAADDSSAVIADTAAVEAQFEAIARAIPPLRGAVTPTLSRQVWPFTALARARAGAFPAAHALIDKTPADCYLCVRMRGNVDALEKNWGGAEFWFVKAAAQAPSLPFGYADWGEMLLAKADYDGAMAKFDTAHRKGPHFADPLEMWGEALIAKNRSDLALAKFEEAAKYAPNWGRLHLKWGEALLWSGNRDDARRQFALASRLDMAPGEKGELAKVRGYS